MFHKLKYAVLLLFILLLPLAGSATHIVGGELYYDYLGGNQYRVTLKVYRDCINGQAPFDGVPASGGGVIYPLLTIYDNAGNFIRQDTFPSPVITNVPPSINSNCITTPNSVCVEEGVYTKTITLTPLAGGYHIVYQRCCRNASILNLSGPGNLGATYAEHIPGPEEVIVNSSPRFKKFPPLFLCNGSQINFDHSATDPDGDSLVYSLCTALNGLSACCPAIGSGGTCAPCPGTPPPFSPVPFINPYNGSYPLASSPAIAVNSSNGFMTGVPNINGQWVVGVCVQEYRAGQLIGTHRREFQFNVVNCIIQIKADYNDQSSPAFVGNILLPNQFCTGRTVDFTNFSQGSTFYHWDFGVAGTSADTSNLANPSYTFPDTGLYIITLIADPGKTCSDTIQKPYYVYPLLAPTFTTPSSQCFSGNSFSFTVGGTFESYATFYWTFGPNATPATSPVQSPTGIVYNAPGKYIVAVDVKQNVCKKTLVDTIRVYKMPQAQFKVDSVEGCDPVTVTFSNTSVSDFPITYMWYFSDGTTSSQQNPTHVFTPSGVYNVSLAINSSTGCPGTNTFVAPGMVTVYPRPDAAFSFSPDSTTVFDPEIFFTNQSQNTFDWTYDFGDGTSSGAIDPIHSYSTYGDYKVVLTAYNGFGCIDTAVRIVTILPEFKFWVPNTFTPGNKDGLNDVFIPIVICAEEYEFYVYDRWGQLIFKSKTPGEGWDGTFRGKPCQQDVYSWFINFTNAETDRYEEHRGHVNLIK